ncbi:MAG TPA: MerR family transcriptional regulator [Myxococcota bacterium]|jgi:DNA-binding transcriptional MerR regulator|nr:MerR family transcriptional regulator [Oligoflexales bacterium]HOE81760.1 MerR family transcriptional regulator [Myxococcota bacterium]HON24860.1 MerR family transcriptional regulator [Myxococcota bacterium]HOS61926.1 MerR family transcriptional regulator [Myxococcota bacterium]HPC92030.1 MerR family transcriptional regulator [Myxococcota bacterium]
MNAPRDDSKAFYRLGEVALSIGVAPSTIRYWQREFYPHVRPNRTKSNHNVYSFRDLAVFAVIKDLVHEQGHSIKEAKRLLALNLASTGGDPMPLVPENAFLDQGGESSQVHESSHASAQELQSLRQTIVELKTRNQQLSKEIRIFIGSLLEMVNDS